MILDESLESPEDFYDLIVEINETACAVRVPSEPTFVKDESALRSISNKPFQFYYGQYATIVYITSAIAREHCFHQGNKSTAMQVFLTLTHLMRNSQPSTRALDILEDRIVEIVEYPSWDLNHFFELLIGIKE